VAKKGQLVYACSKKNSQERVALILKERPNSKKQKQKNHYLLVCRVSRYEKINWCWILLQKRRREMIYLKTEVLNPPVKQRLCDNETEIEAMEANTMVN